MKTALRTKRRPKAPCETGSASASERNVIIHLGDVRRRLLGTARRAAALARRAFALAARRRVVAAFVAATATTAAVARAEQLHVLRDDLRGVFVVTFLVGPFP